MIRITYPKVTIKEGMVTVLLNPVTQVTQPLVHIMANYSTMPQYIVELYKKAKLPLPASEASDSQ